MALLLRRILLPTLKKNLTRNITQHGTALLEETLAHMSPMKRNTSFISTWVKLQFCFSSLVEIIVLNFSIL